MEKKSDGILTRLKINVLAVSRVCLCLMAFMLSANIPALAQEIVPELSQEDSLSNAAIQNSLDEQSDKMDDMLNL